MRKHLLAQLAISCTVLLAFVLGKLGYLIATNILIYFAGFGVIVIFFYRGFWVLKKNYAVYRLWARGEKLEDAVTIVMKETEIELRKSSSEKSGATK